MTAKQRKEIINEIAEYRSAVYSRVFEECEGLPKNIRNAKALAEFIRTKPIFIDEGDIMAGNGQFCNFTVKAKTANKTEPSDPRIGEFFKGNESKLYQFGPGGHVIAGYDWVMEVGIDYLTEMACTCMENAEGYARDVAEASYIITAALSEYIERYAALAQKQGMGEIAAACYKIAHKPADTFFEAVQLMWLIHEVVVFEQYCGSMSLGRLDKVLGVYYEKDIAQGIITNEHAEAIITSFFKKLGGLRRAYQNATVGGSNMAGEYEWNELTVMILQVSKKLMIDQPLLTIRCTPGMPDRVWDRALDLLATGIGMPAFFNDATVIKSKVNVGISEEDAYNYGVVGCVEVSVPGKEFAHTEGMRLNWAKILELMFFGGECQYNGNMYTLKEKRNLDSFKTFDEFYEWFKEEMLHFLVLGMDVMNLIDTDYGQNSPTPYMSSLMRGCIKKGKDVNAGGAVYNLTSVNGAGMADAVDSLCAIKKAVFEEKRVTLPELAGILRRNFDGAKELKRYLERCPKYGNDDDVPDAIMRELVGLFAQKINSYRNMRGGSFQCGLYTVDHHAHMGVRTAALPNGRGAGISLASGFSPCQGADTNGPTAVLNSTAKCDLSVFGNGIVVDLKFQPEFFNKNRIHIRHLIETHFEMGGYEVQINVVDRQTLINAQKEPEKYRNLIVRVSGFSAYFVDLGTITQNEIIARTEYGNSV